MPDYDISVCNVWTKCDVQSNIDLFMKEDLGYSALAPFIGPNRRIRGASVKKRHFVHLQLTFVAKEGGSVEISLHQSQKVCMKGSPEHHQDAREALLRLLRRAWPRADVVVSGLVTTGVSLSGKFREHVVDVRRLLEQVGCASSLQAESQHTACINTGKSARVLLRCTGTIFVTGVLSKAEGDTHACNAVSLALDAGALVPKRPPPESLSISQFVY